MKKVDLNYLIRGQTQMGMQKSIKHNTVTGIIMPDTIILINFISKG
jgi:hypothetical protein